MKTVKLKQFIQQELNIAGFPEHTNSEGYIRLSNYLKENIDDIANEAKE